MTNPCDSDSSERRSMTKKRKRILSAGKRSLSLLVLRICKANAHTTRVGWTTRGLTNAIGKRLRAQHPASRKTLRVDAACASKHAINLPRPVYRESRDDWERRPKRLLIDHFSNVGEKTIAAYGDKTSVEFTMLRAGRNNELHSFIIIFASSKKYFRRVALSKA